MPETRYAEPTISASRVASKGLMGVGAVVLLVAAVLLITKQLRGPTLFKETRYIFVGRTVAEETARLLGNKGQIVAIGFDYKGKQAQVATETEAFLNQTKKLGIAVSGVELQDPDALAQGQRMLPGDIYLA